MKTSRTRSRTPKRKNSGARYRPWPREKDVPAANALVRGADDNLWGSPRAFRATVLPFMRLATRRYHVRECKPIVPNLLFPAIELLDAIGYLLATANMDELAELHKQAVPLLDERDRARGITNLLRQPEKRNDKLGVLLEEVTAKIKAVLEEVAAMPKALRQEQTRFWIAAECADAVSGYRGIEAHGLSFPDRTFRVFEAIERLRTNDPVQLARRGLAALGALPQEKSFKREARRAAREHRTDAIAELQTLLVPFPLDDNESNRRTVAVAYAHFLSTHHQRYLRSDVEDDAVEILQYRVPWNQRSMAARAVQALWSTLWR